MNHENASGAIMCRNVSFGYDGHIVVRNLSFTVNTGDYVCVVGENGSGKTTLLKGLLHLINPAEGAVIFSAGTDRKATGYLSQQAAAKNDFPAGVKEVVLSGMTGRMGLRPFYTRNEKIQAAENMKRLEIFDLQNRCFRELSGGQQRRVLVARALCAGNALLALDEPAAGLDPAASAELYALLKKLNSEDGITVIMVTHDTEAALTFAHKILHLKNSGWFFGETSEYVHSEFAKDFLTGRE
ncbi:MAG: ATP-binding cassette domain-containing protein [Spirochaetaceae bacterium]|nr:ATP-binding cassette domain-containing protein [Spirochaetaceae bacterium]